MVSGNFRKLLRTNCNPTQGNCSVQTRSNVPQVDLRKECRNGKVLWASNSPKNIRGHYLIWTSPSFSPLIFIYLVVSGLSCGMWDLVPWPGIKPRPLALGAQSLSHCTTRKVPSKEFLLSLYSKGNWEHKRENDFLRVSPSWTSIFGGGFWITSKATYKCVAHQTPLSIGF